ncbi:BTAD domain-containing putative transcriptional regulator [Patulibacter minatonensis]|uniref:BTAD domain-containing putative transcriptional regulator n=1 Tax=Patulibacter minatonensis TaxID=298163 RepID=UPI0004B85E09|nr:BTAD domain-containing putative transcriptional regulator [Patulibacter minatonensis]
MHYRLLGPLTAFRPDDAGDPAPVELGPPKQRAVLALLLLHRTRVVPTDRLIDALWGDAAPPSALASLQAYVSNLRGILREHADAEPAIVRRAGGYVVDVPADRVDLAGFIGAAEAVRDALEQERWADALRLADDALAGWGGELLEDFRDEPWRRGEAAGLDELHTECREARITALLAVRRIAPALVAASELRAAHPLGDGPCRLQMLALHLAGRSTEALDAYREHAARLDEELGLEPGTEVRELEVAILRHDPALATWPRSAGPAGDGAGTGTSGGPGPAGPAPGDPAAPGTGSAGGTPSEAAQGEAAPRTPAPATTLVGREHEQRVLRDTVAAAAGGAARWLVLTGTAGIGKTRLAEELGVLSRAAGAREVWARCSDEDGAPAWWPIRQIVRALGEDPDALLVPPPGADTDEARFALYERVALLLQSAAADGPLAVVVDDVQWADRTSARCLAHLVAAVRELPVAFALTLRSDEDTAGVASLLTALARSDRYQQLAVGPLGPGEVADLAARIAGEALSEQRAGELAAHTGGNPLFVSEFARLPAAEREGGSVPLAVRTVLGRRLDGLDPEVLTVLRAAAVSGDVVDVPVLVGITGLDPDAAADLLDDAADEHVLVPTPDTGGYAFAHGLLRQEVLAGTPEMRRRRLHLRAARTLAAGSGSDRVSRRARHLLDAMPLAEPAEVVEACRAAARLAEERWSSETAADWWAAALRVLDRQPEEDRAAGERDGLVLSRVFALARAGRGQSVLDLLDEALSDAVRAGSTDTVGRLAAALVRTAGAWPWTAYGADPRSVIERLEGVRSVVRDDPDAHVRVLAALAVGHCYHDDPAVPEDLSSEALRIAEDLGRPETLADALIGRLIAYSGVAAHADEAVALTARLVALPREDERLARVDATAIRSVVAMAHFALGDVALAERVVAEGVAESEVLGMPVVRVQLRWMQGTLAAWRGDFDVAARQYATSGRVHAQTDLSYAGSETIAAQGLAFVRDRLAEIDLRSADAQVRLVNFDQVGPPEPDAWEAAVRAARGERDRASAAAGRWLDLQTSWKWITMGHVVLVAHACADVGATEHADRLLGLLRPYAGLLASAGQACPFGPVDLATGRLHALRGDAATARTLLTGALEQAERTGGRPFAERARAALDVLPG